MKKFLIFFLGVLAGGLLGAIYVASRSGIAGNSGSEFYGSEFTEVLKKSSKGLCNNNGSKFYSDLYIKEKFKKSNESNA